MYAKMEHCGIISFPDDPVARINFNYYRHAYWFSLSILVLTLHPPICYLRDLLHQVAANRPYPVNGPDVAAPPGFMGVYEHCVLQVVEVTVPKGLTTLVAQQVTRHEVRRTLMQVLVGNNFYIGWQVIYYIFTVIDIFESYQLPIPIVPYTLGWKGWY